MDFLFIHGNYPGQFRHLAPLLASTGNKVVFLTNRQDAKMDVVRRRNTKLHTTSKNERAYTSLPAEQRGCKYCGQAILKKLTVCAERDSTREFVITCRDET